MIRPPDWDGVAFSETSEGDLRSDAAARSAVAASLGIDADWARVRQVHGNNVSRVTSPGVAGEADALWTTERALPLAVFTADCLGVVLVAPGAVGVAHAGWRGAAAGVVPRLRDMMTETGHAPDRAAVGPGIGPCCFEVGSEVANEFVDHVAHTSGGATSVNLLGAVSAQLHDLEIWSADVCTMHEEGWFSHRADGTSERMATIGWLQ